MISTPALIGFLSASILLAITPGPGIMYVLTRSLAGGRREGIQSSMGTLVGGFAHVLAAGLGLSAILATSAIAYQAVRWTGALYLVYLGVRMIRSAGDPDGGDEQKPAGSPFLQGIVTEALNPKTALFFLSFIPQFIDPRASAPFWQFLLLGTISVCLNTSADVLVATFAGPIGRRLLGSPMARRRQRQATGSVMIGLGIYAVAREA